MAEIYRTIEKHFKGDKALMIGDCCYSGTLSTQMKSLETEKAYACISSSVSNLEAGMYWTFTGSLVSGFTGKAYVDANADGKVSLAELGQHSREAVGVFMNQEAQFSTSDSFPKTFILARARERSHEDVGKYYEIKINPKARWQKAKLVKVEHDERTFLYYDKEDFARLKALKDDSRDIRTFSRECFKMGDVVDVRDGGRWYPAKILAIEKETGLHTIRCEKRADWGGLYFYEDLRLRPSN